MAKFTNIDSLTYCGKEASEIFVKNLYESDVKGYGIKYLPEVKGKQKLYDGSISDLYQKYSCQFAPKGSVKLNESTIEPTTLKVNLEICYDEFWGTFLSEQTEISLNGGIPQSFSEFLFNKVLVPELKKEYEELFFNGDTTGTGTTYSNKTYLKLADGIVKKVKNDSKSKKVTGAELTSSNIIAKVEEVAEAVNNMEDIDVEGFKIFMNYMDVRKLITALGVNSNSPLTNQMFSNYSKVGDKLYVYGYEIVPTRIEKDVIMASHPMNLVLGFDASDSEISYKMIDMKESTLDNMMRVAVVTNIAIGVVFPETVVIAKKD